MSYEHLKVGDHRDYEEEGAKGRVEIVEIDREHKMKGSKGTFTRLRLRALEDITGGRFDRIAVKGEEWDATWTNEGIANSQFRIS